MGFYVSPSSQLEIFFGSQDEKFVPAHYKNFLSNELIYHEPFDAVSRVLGLDQLVFAHQTHGIFGTHITISGVPVFTQESDFLITTQSKTGIAVATADCVPLIIYSTDYSVVAVVHAGWRGTVASIMAHALEQFYTLIKNQKETVRIIIGPAARVCCYKVSQDFVTQIDPVFYNCVQERDGNLFFDTVAANKLIIARMQIPESAIQDVSLCTIHDAGYCSHRASGGLPERQYTVVSLK